MDIKAVGRMAGSSKGKRAIFIKDAQGKVVATEAKRPVGKKAGDPVLIIPGANRQPVAIEICRPLDRGPVVIVKDAKSKPVAVETRCLVCEQINRMEMFSPAYDVECAIDVRSTEVSGECGGLVAIKGFNGRVTKARVYSDLIIVMEEQFTGWPCRDWEHALKRGISHLAQYGGNGKPAWPWGWFGHMDPCLGLYGVLTGCNHWSSFMAPGHVFNGVHSSPYNPGGAGRIGGEFSRQARCEGLWFNYQNPFFGQDIVRGIYADSNYLEYRLPHKYLGPHPDEIP